MAGRRGSVLTTEPRGAVDADARRLCSVDPHGMSTAIQPEHTPRPEGSAQSLMLWMAVALLSVTALIVAGITLFSTTVGMFVAYGAVLVGTLVVFAYITRFIGPEDEEH